MLSRQKATQWHTAVEQRKHLSPYLYDTVAEAEAYSHLFTSCPVQLRTAAVESIFMDTSTCRGEAWLHNTRRNKPSSRHYVKKMSRVIELDQWFRSVSSYAPMKAMKCLYLQLITARWV